MSKKNKQSVGKLKKLIKNQDIQKIKNQIRIWFISQNDYFQQSQSISNSRSSCFPKRSKALYKQSSFTRSYEQSYTSGQLTKYQKMKMDDILQKEQINSSFDYLFNQFKSNAPLFITSCVQSKISQYAKIMQFYLLDATLISQITSIPIVIDWNLVISSWYWTRWTQNYKYLSILNSIIGKLFWGMYRFYMQKQLQLYQTSILGSLRENSHQAKNFKSYGLFLDNFQVFDIKIQCFLSKEYLVQNLNPQYQNKLQQELISYLLQKQQAYEYIYVRYETFKEETQPQKINQIQSILKIKYSNYHQIVYNDNVEIMVQKLLLKLTQKTQKEQIHLKEDQISLECKTLKLVTQYISTRMIILDQDQNQSCFQQSDYKQKQTEPLLEYMFKRLSNFQKLSQSNFYDPLINQIVISCKSIYQLDAKDSYLDQIKILLNSLIYFVQNNQRKSCYQKNFEKFIQLHNNLIEMILNLQTTFLNQYENQYIDLKQYTKIQYFSYFEGLLYCFFLKKKQQLMNVIVNATDYFRLEYNLLQLLEVNLRQQNLNIIAESCDPSLILKLKQYYQKQFQIINFNKNRVNFRNTQNSNQIIVEYFFEVIFKYCNTNQESNSFNPQIQI